MIIDFHTYVGKSMLGQESTEEELLENMEKNQVTMSVVCPVKTIDPFFEKQNEYIAELQKKYPDKIAGFCRIDPNLGKDSEKLLTDSIEHLHLKGLVLHPWEETFAINDKKVFPFMEICSDRKIPVLVETGYPWLSHCFQVGSLAEKYPDVTFIMSHGGQFDSSGYALTDVDYVMNKYGNLVIETSGDYSDEGIENIPVRLGESRVLFGSHFPWLCTELEIYRVQRANLPKECKEAIFYKNAEKILNL